MNLTAESLLTLSEMIDIYIDHATIYCHSRYNMNSKYEYATDKIYNLVGNEGKKALIPTLDTYIKPSALNALFTLV